jgi:hypothetical protein
MRNRKFLFFMMFLFVIILLKANGVLAGEVEEETPLHEFFEKVVGPLGSILGIVGMIIFWKLSSSMEPLFKICLRLFVAVLLWINLDSVTFALHGVGVFKEGTSIYLERTFRFLGLFTADIGAFWVLLRVLKEKKKSQTPS